MQSANFTFCHLYGGWNTFLFWPYVFYVCIFSTVAGSFTGQSDYGISFSPAGYDVTEGDNITFTCKADIGRTPQGNLAWYYYMHYEGYPIAQPISNQASKDRPEVARTCSQSQRSVLVMTMRRNLNKYLVRCTLQQDVSTPDGDDHRQTEKFNVKCKSTVYDMMHFCSVVQVQGSKKAIVCSYLRVPQAAGQVEILKFQVKINFLPKTCVERPLENRQSKYLNDEW